jgi:hypothetical protein
MRISTVYAVAAMAAAVVGVLAGCSGGGSINMSPAASTSHGVRQSMSDDGTGLPPQFLARIHSGGGSLPAVQTKVQPNIGPNRLAVSEFNTPADVKILNSSYTLISTITNGVSTADGIWYDQAKNLYVANYAAAVVQEYANGATSPTFTYSAGLVDPINVTTDENGNVFVADYNYFNMPAWVNEYAQGSNTVRHTCSIVGAPDGIAIGENGQVFVGYELGEGNAAIVEFKHGLSGCNGTTLGVAMNFIGGMQIDKQKNLVVGDLLQRAVDIIAPPYSSVTSSITNVAQPFRVALSKDNSLIFIADIGQYTNDVVVDNYPSGSNVTTLGSANGLSNPAGVATRPFQH